MNKFALKEPLCSCSYVKILLANGGRILTSEVLNFLSIEADPVIHKNLIVSIGGAGYKISPTQLVVEWKSNISQPYFFLPGKVCFDHFLAIIGWVIENKVFFYGAVSFFRVLKLSEWVKCKLFQEKKTLWEVKKKAHLKSQNRNILQTFYWFNKGNFLNMKWMEGKLFLVGFLLVAKKQTKFYKFEWFSAPHTFPGKKLYLFHKTNTEYYMSTIFKKK